MNQPGHSLVPISGGHEVHVTYWGNPANRAIIMWHGLARTGRDFDELACAMAERYFIVCPDTIGRGLSSWSATPERDYNMATYCDIAIGLLDHFGLERAGWLGTSMGGLIGMHMATGKQSDRLEWLIINDIGPEIPRDAIDRILTYAGISPEFHSLAEAEKWLRTVYGPFGEASDMFWQRMTRTSVRRRDDGSLTTHYDPKIITQFSASPDDFDNWQRFEHMTLPLHIIWGRQSDILIAEILERMRAIKPDLGVSVFDTFGHAPTLSRPDDITAVSSTIGALESMR